MPIGVLLASHMDSDFSLHADQKMRNDFLARTILENERLKSEISQLNGWTALSPVIATEHALQQISADPLARTIYENEQLKSEIARLKGGAVVPVGERPVAFTEEPPEASEWWNCCARRAKLTSRFQALPGETPVLTTLGNVHSEHSFSRGLSSGMALGGVVSSSISPEAIDVARSVYSEALRRYRTLQPFDWNPSLQPFDDWEVLEVLTQVVAGTNFFIKVRIHGETEVLPKPGASAISLALSFTEDEYLHLRIFQPLPHTGEKPQLVSMLRGDEAAGPLVYFV